MPRDRQSQTLRYTQNIQTFLAIINLDCTVKEGVRLWLSVAVMKIFVTLFDLLLDIVPRLF
ncbi:hypothetical protein BDV34DRAFT_195301 [Aspergillus parasiticus]|uniref:Uncharacterized protein n=1 Tax=Aspergillus parasiticus TaxID=5067 RepID=A0A5N6DKD7_ASPPA|nr:hypothetical protein BDV34DRAFT_195301 [Aspergillus parasiticus]